MKLQTKLKVRGIGITQTLKIISPSSAYLSGVKPVNKPVYSSALITLCDELIMLIIDLYQDESPTMTVTNGVEIVLREVKERWQPYGDYQLQRILYRDTDGRWDEIVVNNDFEFMHFAPAPDHMVADLQNGYAGNLL